MNEIGFEEAFEALLLLPTLVSSAKTDISIHHYNILGMDEWSMHSRYRYIQVLSYTKSSS